MAGKTAEVTKSAIVDFIELLAKALLSGIGVAVAMSLAILALSATAQAAGMVSANEAKTGMLLLRTDSAAQYVAAPRIETEVAIQVTGMIARTRVSQVFHNPDSEFIEGLYVFPL